MANIIISKDNIFAQTAPSSGDVLLGVHTDGTLYTIDSTGFTAPVGATGAVDYYPYYVVTVATYSVSAVSMTPQYVGVSFSGTVSLYLPNADSISGKVVVVKDETGISATRPITIYPFTGQKIDKESLAILSVNYGSLSMIARDSKWWII